jgi:copper chaperone CopZ
MTEQTFSVPGISCDHCATAIRESVRVVPGVHAVAVDVAGRTVRVTGDGDTAAVRAAIADAGYQAA